MPDTPFYIQGDDIHVTGKGLGTFVETAFPQQIDGLEFIRCAAAGLNEAYVFRRGEHWTIYPTPLLGSVSVTNYKL